MNEQRFPKGWDEQRVKRLIAELDARTDDEWIAADEAAAADGGDQARSGHLDPGLAGHSDARSVQAESDDARIQMVGCRACQKHSLSAAPERLTPRTAPRWQ